MSSFGWTSGFVRNVSVQDDASFQSRYFSFPFQHGAAQLSHRPRRPLCLWEFRGRDNLQDGGCPVYCLGKVNLWTVTITNAIH